MELETGSADLKAGVATADRRHEMNHSLVPAPRFFAVIAYLVLALCIGEAVAQVTILLREHSHRRPLLGPVYEGQPWADPLWQEWTRFLHSKAYRAYEPFVVNGHLPYHSRHLNVDQTYLGPLRRTSAPECSGEAPLVVWTFGGSTTFGIGVPDDMTWPSYLGAQLRAKARRCASVINFGAVDWVSNQEIIRLVQALKAGGRPNAVVFLDGVDETWNGVIEPGVAEAYIGYAYDRQALERSPWFGLGELGLVRLARERIWPSGTEHIVSAFGISHRVGWSGGELEERARHTVENYVANIKVLKALSGHYGFRYFAFWQPTLLYARNTSVPFEQQVIKDPQEAIPNDVLRRSFRATYSEAEGRANAGGFVSLVHVFDSIPTPLYSDAYNVGPAGNQALAAAIAAIVASDLQANKL